MIIDGHSHVTLPVEEHIQRMDKSNIDKTILFSTTFHPELARNALEVKAEMQYLNDLLAGKKGSMIEARKSATMDLVNVINQYPNRYVGFGTVPVGLNLHDTKQYMKNYIIANNLVGIGEFTLGVGQAHLLENIFLAVHELHNMPIWIHAFYPYTLNDIKETLTIASQYPDIPVILGHLGGTNWIQTMDMVAEHSNLYLDTSAFFSTFVLSTIINEIPEKCIFGVDSPFGDIELSKQAILKYSKTPDIAKVVLGDNIAKMLDL